MDVSQQTLITAENVADLIGNTPLLRISSLSELTGCDIFLKCEQLNPGGSIKDRAALQMVLDAIESGELKKGMTIVEGTAGNTGIGLAVVAKALGYNLLAVMPRDQTEEKERMITLHGGTLKLVDPCPFSNENHFYHTACRLAEENPKKYWWANQFENLSNFKAHCTRTGPEIEQQVDGKLDFFVSVSGTGGTIGGNSVYLKEEILGLKVILIDPEGSGSCSYFHTGEYKAEGQSITEGIGNSRVTENLIDTAIDDAVQVTDQEMVSMVYQQMVEEGWFFGSSTGINLCAALKIAEMMGPGHTIVTILADTGHKYQSRLFNAEYLREKGLSSEY